MSNKVLTELYAHMNTVPLTRNEHLEEERSMPQQPRAWVGLTDEERIEIARMKWWDWEDAFDVDDFTRAIESKLKEKNHECI